MTETRSPDPVSRAAADWLRARLASAARLTADSRRVRRGDAFFAWPGAAVDGRRFCAAARAAGAAALVVEADGWDAFAAPATAAGGAATTAAGRAGTEAGTGAGIDAGTDAGIDAGTEAGTGSCADTTLAVTNLRARAGPIASAWLGEPSLRLVVVAVTGTNGKTSCTHWIAAGCNERHGSVAVGGRPGTSPAARAVVIGTLGEGVPGRLEASARLTTPDALELQQSLARFAAAGIELVAIEASSIGLIQHRLDGTRIAVAVMTNLTRDHLDAHGTMADYAAAKGRLFDWHGLGAAVVNLDDPAAAAMLDRVQPGTRRIGYTVRADASGSMAAVSAGVAVDDWLGAGEPDADGSFELAIGTVKRNLRLQVIGGFNRSNALAVAGVWLALGWTPDAIVRGLEGLQPVPGRLQMIGDLADGTRPLVVIDYAHTPDALANVLTALRPIAERRGGRLWCVFGAGGDRDRGKRAAMAAAVEAQADHVVLTSDNPRSEDPARILTDLEAGLTKPARLVEPDRAGAIGRAVLAAAAADVVLIAGKGHEDYQEIAGVRHPFSDVAAARSAHAGLAVRHDGDGDG